MWIAWWKDTAGTYTCIVIYRHQISHHLVGSLSKALHRKWLRGSTKVMPHDVCDNAKAHIWYCKHESCIWTLKSGVVRSPFSCTHLSSLPGQVQRSRCGCSTMRKQDFLSKLESKYQLAWHSIIKHKIKIFACEQWQSYGNLKKDGFFFDRKEDLPNL